LTLKVLMLNATQPFEEWKCLCLNETTGEGEATEATVEGPVERASLYDRSDIIL
jgi:hypothetical protein